MCCVVLCCGERRGTVDAEGGFVVAALELGHHHGRQRDLRPVSKRLVAKLGEPAVRRTCGNDLGLVDDVV